MEAQFSLRSLLLGAVLTFITLYIIDYLKTLSEQKNKKKNFQLFVKLELEVLSKALERLDTGLHYANYYDYNIINRIKESLANLEKVRTDVIYLTSPDLKAKFVDLLSDITNYVASVNVIQDIFYRESDEVRKQPTQGNKKSVIPTQSKTMSQVLASFERRRTDASITYVEIKRRLDELIKDIS